MALLLLLHLRFAPPSVPRVSMATPIDDKVSVAFTGDQKEIDSNSNIDDLDVNDVERRLQELTKECPSFYKNRNLFILYLLIIPGCLVPAVTLGFDGAMMNGLQAVPAWDDCA
jgi:hypothetical protein